MISSQDLCNARILVVDDEPLNIRLLERLLAAGGYNSVATTTNPTEALGLFRQLKPDLVLLDLHMPEMTGFEVMEALRPEIPEDGFLPILMLTGNHDPEIQRQALAAGARDFVTKPFRAQEVLLRIKNMLEMQILHRNLRHHNEGLEATVQERTRDLMRAQNEILNRLALAGEYRDDDTGQHAKRVGQLSGLVAQAMGLDADFANLIRQAAPLHDLGKIGISDTILLKKGPLTDEEFAVIKTHTMLGARLLSGSDFAVLQLAEVIAMNHHERWDGQGYYGKAGEDIPLSGRIVAVVDTFDAMTSARPYRPAGREEDALIEIIAQRGHQFDPRVVDAFEGLAMRGRISDLLSAAEHSDNFTQFLPTELTPAGYRLHLSPPALTGIAAK